LNTVQTVETLYKKTTYAKLLSIGIAQKHPTCTSNSRGETGSVRTSETTNLVGV
jgi:hypothetical protein